jgi:acetylornithine deacetylase/succinyl-diaminopimelate desuccinylase-like protein
MAAQDRDHEVIDLLQGLIRNRCVNDGTKESGHEIRSVELLESFLAGCSLDMQRYEPAPGRASLIARIQGSDSSAPTLMLMGHTDVVAANPAGWRHDPFGGELIDGFVWGRGAVDMLGHTASMAVALKRLATQDWRPRGTLAYLAVADEEAGGTYGSGWLTEHEPDAVKAHYLLTEIGGADLALPSASGALGPKLPVTVGEKGFYWCNIRVRGTPGHGSMPRRTGNALVKSAELIRRIADYQPPAQIHETWRRFVETADLPPQMARTLIDPAALGAFIASAPDEGLGLMVRACTHTTFAPTVVHGGVKTNIIPDTVDLQLDIRTLPGQSTEHVRQQLDEALGDLGRDVEISSLQSSEASVSSIDTPLWQSVTRATDALIPGARAIPFLLVGTSDARYFRRTGTVAYGAGLFNPKTSFLDLAKMIHGDDERVDVESLSLMTQFWGAVAKDLLGA